MTKEMKILLVVFIHAFLLLQTSATFPATNDASSFLLFGGIKLFPPISTNLLALDIHTANAIQQETLAPITAGITCCIHSQTGSGKTLAYLLPLLKRLYGNDKNTRELTSNYSNHNKEIKSNVAAWTGGLQALIIVPSKDLALQVARDIHMLTGNTEQVVQLCAGNKENSTICTHPILIGTPAKMLSMLRMLSAADITAINYCVIDEVDQLLQVPGKYASSDERRGRKHSLNPLEDIVSMLLTLRSQEQLEQLQFVSASATVGRPLRRELFRVLNGGSKGYTGMVPVLRPKGTVSSEIHLDCHYRKKLHVEAEDGRAVSIPASIKHVALICNNDNQDEFATKLSLLKDQWMVIVATQQRENHEFKAKGLLFVPVAEEVERAISILRFWGVIAVPLVGHVEEGTEGCLYVASYKASRGLHVKDIEHVLLLEVPESMDQYLHLAGRTGRQGSRHPGQGCVYSVTDPKKLKRLRSWERPLGIDFTVES